MSPLKTPIYQIQQIREFESLAINELGISEENLMQRAGKAAFDFFVRRFPKAEKVTFFCGSGKNGGDGYILADLLHERGLKVTIWQVGERNKPRENHVNAELYTAESDIGHPDVIVDAICGIGVRDNLRTEVMQLIDNIHATQSPIFAIDIPTGVDADTGKVLGKAIKATATITFIGLKIGLLTGEGTSYTGELALNDLQLSELSSRVKPVAEKVNMNTYAAYLKPRARNWHKGLSGHVLIIGGDAGYSGAVRMAAQAALRVGAGLVSIATRKEHAPMLNLSLPEVMCHAVETVDALDALMANADVIVIGPGLGQLDWGKMVWKEALKSSLPLVMDADGLNLLAHGHAYSDKWILTPHPGEAGRLLGERTEAIQNDRLQAGAAIARRYGGVCVLKGAGSLIFSPHELPALCDKGNPGMATAGMGDVLSGVIAGLLAQGIPPGDAAKLGVILHATAGDLAAREGERGMMATDLMPYLRRLSNMAIQTG